VEATTIAWVLPHEGHDDEAAIAALRAQGLRVLACASGAALPAEAGVRVLRAELFGDAAPAPRVPARRAADADRRRHRRAGGRHARIPESPRRRGARPAAVELLLLRLARLLKHAGGEARLHSLQFSDELTGLANRKRWQALLASGAGRTRWARSRAVVLFDLDHFKQINDRFGHQAGDQVLRESRRCCSRRWRRATGWRAGAARSSPRCWRATTAPPSWPTCSACCSAWRATSFSRRPPRSGFERLVNRFDDTAPAPLDGEPRSAWRCRPAPASPSSASARPSPT
jgi:hypothetical protein